MEGCSGTAAICRRTSSPIRGLVCELENALVLVHEKKISSLKELLPVLELATSARRPLLIVAEDVDGEALAALT